MSGGQAGLEPQNIYWFERQIETQIRCSKAWGSLTGRQAILHVAHSSGLPEEKLLAIVDAAIDSDCAALNLPAPALKPDVYIFAKPMDLGNALGFAAPVDYGLSVGGWAAVVLQNGWTEQALKPVAAQEIGYVLVHDQLGLFGWPIFNEGIALYFKGWAENAPWVTSPEPTEPTRISELVRSAHSPADFQEGANFIAYLIRRDKGNPDRVKAVVQDMAQARLAEVRLRHQDQGSSDVDDAFKSVYGKGLDALEHDWRTGK